MAARGKDSKTTALQIRTYFSSLPEKSKREMKIIRDAIRAAAPKAVEHFSYGIPGFRLDGRPLAWYAAWKQHTSMYPLTAAMKKAAAKELEDYKVAKGTIQFPLDKPVPVTLIRKMVKARAAEIRETGK